MQPNERRRKIIERISFRRYATMKNLAEEFGVSWHTIYRDIQILSEEYPLIVTRGNGGGITLPQGYYISKNYLSSKQVNLLEHYLENAQGEERTILESILLKFALKL